MGRDTVTRVRIQGMRALADVGLRTKGLTVLIGDNGSGKSTIVEALELLHKMARPGDFVTQSLKRRDVNPPAWPTARSPRRRSASERSRDRRGARTSPPLRNRARPRGARRARSRTPRASRRRAAGHRRPAAFREADPRSRRALQAAPAPGGNARPSRRGGPRGR
ncbi:MAG: AAA family ATPase [Planctomycetes bacterium]|nr:AAA family ATPase [Planctomycetota bacterium]